MYVVTQNAFQEDPALTTPAFNLLPIWLDKGVDSHDETYLEMRCRLFSYFDRRNRSIADDTLTRIAATLAKDGAIAITPPARYCTRPRGLSCWRTSGASTNNSALTRHWRPPRSSENRLWRRPGSFGGCRRNSDGRRLPCRARRSRRTVPSSRASPLVTHLYSGVNRRIRS